MKPRKLLLSISFILISALLLVACAPSTAKEELVVYSSRREQFVQPLIEAFEQETGITVRLLSGNESLVNKILEEQRRPVADVFLSNDAAAMEYLRLQGALQSNTSVHAQAVDERFRAEDASWVGLSARTRVLMYNKDLIGESEMPANLWDLTDPKYKGQFMITQGGNGSMVAHVAALRAEWGDEKTQEWMERIRENAGAIVSGHTDIRKAVGAGEYKFGLVNNYYYHLQLAEDRDNNVGAIYPDQGPEEMGSFVNAAGVALIKGAPNTAAAKAFIDFLLQPAQQEIFASNSMEVPLNPEVPAVPAAKSITEYQVMDVPLREVGAAWADVKQLIEAAGLDLGK